MDKRKDQTQKIIDELMSMTPDRIESRELCHKVQILPRELSYILRVFPDKFDFIDIKRTENGLFLKFDLGKFIEKF